MVVENHFTLCFYCDCITLTFVVVIIKFIFGPSQVLIYYFVIRLICFQCMVRISKIAFCDL